MPNMPAESISIVANGDVPIEQEIAKPKAKPPVANPPKETDQVKADRDATNAAIEAEFQRKKALRTRKVKKEEKPELIKPIGLVDREDKGVEGFVKPSKNVVIAKKEELPQFPEATDEMLDVESKDVVPVEEVPVEEKVMPKVELPEPQGLVAKEKKQVEGLVKPSKSVLITKKEELPQFPEVGDEVEPTPEPKVKDTYNPNEIIQGNKESDVPFVKPDSNISTDSGEKIPKYPTALEIDKYIPLKDSQELSKKIEESIAKGLAESLSSGVKSKVLSSLSKSSSMSVEMTENMLDVIGIDLGMNTTLGNSAAIALYYGINSLGKDKKEELGYLIESYKKDPEMAKALVSNWIERKTALFFETEEAISDYTPSQAVEGSNYKLREDESYGTNIPRAGGKDLVMTPMVVDLNKFKLKYRNRGDYTPIDNTMGSLATMVATLNPKGARELIKPFDYIDKETGEKKHSTGGLYHTYIGLTPEGKLKVGNLDAFDENDVIGRTTSNVITGFKLDKEGNMVFEKRNKNNPSRPVPVVYVKKDDGSVSEGSLPFLTYGGLANKDSYGSIQGGQILMMAGDEAYVVAGSIQNIYDQYTSMSKRYPNGIRMVNLDNGSFTKGLRTTKGHLTEQELINYDDNHATGGNFLYLDNEESSQGVADVSSYNKFMQRVYADPQIRAGYTEVYGKDYKEVLAKLNTPERVRPEGNKYNEFFIPTTSVRNKRDRSHVVKKHPLAIKPNSVVFHHTAYMNKDLSSVIHDMADRKSENSAHMLIGFDGVRVRMANPSQVAFHAGHSVFNGVEEANNFSIGIEFQGNTITTPLTEQQIESAIEYLEPLIKMYNIRLEDVTTHEIVRELFLKEHPERRKKTKDKSKVWGKPDVTAKEFNRLVNKLLEDVYIPVKYVAGKDKAIGRGTVKKKKKVLRNGGLIYKNR